jgi:predicted acyl esterase
MRPGLPAACRFQLMAALLAAQAISAPAAPPAPEDPPLPPANPRAEAIEVGMTALLGNWPAGSRRESTRVPMRDGAWMATEILFPPGAGPWPVILCRTPYGRVAGAKYSRDYAGKGVVWVSQDSRGRGGSTGTLRGVDNENEIEDGYDAIDWIVCQTWSNGRVGMMGGSGNGMCARMAYLAKHPALKVVWAANTAGNTYLHWSFENGVRRGLHRWCNTFRNIKNSEIIPTITEYDLTRWRSLVAEAARHNPTVLFVDDGWFNIFGDGAIEDFMAFGPTGRVYGKVRPTTHGRMERGLTFPSRETEAADDLPSPLDVLIDGAEIRAPSRLRYFVMGDVHDPSAPGNTTRVTRFWPPPNVPVRFHLTPDGGLSRAPARSPGGRSEYSYDPRDPTPSCGGGFSYSAKEETGWSGALDQRVQSGRRDILRFYSAPLTEPLEVAGKLAAELYFSTDVPDTTFMVRLIDVYPDGYEMMIREGAAMARYRDGLDRPHPVRKGDVNRLSIAMNSTAIVFNRGHRIGVYIASASNPAYEVHPNSYEPVKDYDQAPVAHQVIHCTEKFPSAVILPVASLPDRLSSSSP